MAEHQIVDLAVAGSNPASHPIPLLLNSSALGCFRDFGPSPLVNMPGPERVVTCGDSARQRSTKMTMRHVSLGKLEVTRLGLGTMGMSAYYTGAGTDDSESVRTIQRALDLGIDFIDTAEVYGPYTNEQLVGKALVGRRDQV